MSSTTVFYLSAMKHRTNATSFQQPAPTRREHTTTAALTSATSRGEAMTEYPESCLIDGIANALSTPPFQDSLGFMLAIAFGETLIHRLFGLQTNELVVMDPQQRSILHRTAVSLRRMCVDDGRASVYIGAATSDYKSIVYEARFEANPFFSTGSAFISVIAGRVSFVFNLSGGSLAIDTACSSAMCAIHVARGDVDVPLRITGGVNALLDARSSAMFAGAGMLANDGRCKTFDVAADGYSRAEACAIVVIHRYCVKPTASIVLLAGTSVNQDGRSSALTAPNGPSQTRVIRDATCVIDRTDLRLLSLHGTGTPLGDPIEIGAASAVIPTNAVLMATKTSCAHSESPSGLMGALAALTDAHARGYVSDRALADSKCVRRASAQNDRLCDAENKVCRHARGGTSSAGRRERICVPGYKRARCIYSISRVFVWDWSSNKAILAPDTVVARASRVSFDSATL